MHDDLMVLVEHDDVGEAAGGQAADVGSLRQPGRGRRCRSDASASVTSGERHQVAHRFVEPQHAAGQHSLVRSARPSSSTTTCVSPIE